MTGEAAEHDCQNSQFECQSHDLQRIHVNLLPLELIQAKCRLSFLTTTPLSHTV